MLNGKSILITGGTGSFGKKFAETILRNYPEIQRIVIFSRDEYKQFQMSNMPPFAGNAKMRFFIGDVRDEQRLCRALDGVDIVVHAAALKQVPACEYNPFEAVKTNVIGAENVINAAINKKVKKVVALSTDKACSPINLYGATKLCSDKLFIAGNAYVGSKETRFSVVRYGNVAGSRGSVIPYFQKLIAEKAKSLPITDTRMTRFWLVLEEAVEMVLHALEVMHGGELFVRKIPSMKITDLAKAMAPDLPIEEVGIRPGEKIHEMMISEEDSINTCDFGKYYIIGPNMQWWNLAKYDLKGKPVPERFEYHSGNNSEWLTIGQMRNLISALC
ncbi:MAG: UDP-N-acetylglucosamine 4,6-dehydratase (inverting) [Phycisphaerales bacterium]